MLNGDRPGATKQVQPGAEGERCLRFRPGGALYVLRDDQDEFQTNIRELLGVCRDARLVLPDAAADMRSFVDGLVSFYGAFGKAWMFAVSDKSQTGYIWKRQARSWLELAHNRAPPGVFDDLFLEDLQRVMPDMNARATRMLDVRASQIVAQVGVPALSLSAWCCYAGFLSQEARDFLEASEPAIVWRAWHRLREKHGEAPFPHALARWMMEQTKEQQTSPSISSTRTNNHHFQHGHRCRHQGFSSCSASPAPSSS